MKTRRCVLVVDDQIAAAGSVHQRSFLRAVGSLPYSFSFETCATDDGAYDAEKAVAYLRRHPQIDLVLLDIRFGEESDSRLGFTILQRLTAEHPMIPVVVMSSVDRDIEAL